MPVAIAAKRAGEDVIDLPKSTRIVGPDPWTDVTSAYSKTGLPMAADKTGVADCATAFANAESDGHTTFVPTGTFRIGANTVIANRLVFARGATLSVDTGVTVTINGTVEAEPRQIFQGLGTIAFGAQAATVVHAGWWGADPTETNDSQPAIQSALTAANAMGGSGAGAVLLGKGSYLIGSALAFPSGVRLLGEGVDRTTLVVPAGSNYTLLGINGASNIEISDFKLSKQAGALLGAQSYGIRIRGSCDNLRISDIVIDGFGNSIRVDGAEGTGSGTTETYTLRMNSVTSGTYKLGIYPPLGGPIQWTAAINATAVGTAVAAAINALALMSGQPACVGSGGPANGSATTDGTPIVLTFPGYLGQFPFDIRVDNIDVDGSVVVERTAFGGQWVTNLRMHRVSGYNSPTSWNFQFAYCRDVIVEACRAKYAHLDGIKLLRHVDGMLIDGGQFDDNGTGFWTHPSFSGGDGIDMYSGGRNIRIVGASFKRNTSNGIQCKTDDQLDVGDLSGYGNGQYGLNRNLEFVGINASFNQYGSGILIEQGQQSGNAFPACYITIDGGMFEGNGSNGIELNTTRATVQGAKCRRNRSAGIFVNGPLITGVAQPSRYIDLIGNHCVQNGMPNSTGYGIHLAHCTDVNIIGGTCLSVDDDALRFSSNETTFEATHYADVYVGGDCKRILIRDVHVLEGTATGGRSIQVAPGATEIFTHQRGTLIPNTNTIYGSPGSTYIKTDGTTYADQLWVRTSGLVGDTPGWERSTQGVAVVALPAPAASYRGTIARLDNAAGTADGLYHCLKRQDDSYFWERLDALTELPFAFNGGGTAITAGAYVDFYCPFAFSISEWTTLSDRSGSIQFDIRKCTYAQFDAGATHPVGGDSIVAAAPPSIVATYKGQSSTLTGWTIQVAAGDVLRVYVTSAATVQQATLVLKVRKGNSTAPYS